MRRSARSWPPRSSSSKPRRLRSTPTASLALLSTWAAGYGIPAGIRTPKSGCTIAAKRAGWATTFTKASGQRGRWGDLDGDLLHFTCDTFSHHVRNVDRYTTKAAQEIAASGRRVGWGRLLLAPAWAFFRTYFLQRGFLDGFEGFLIAQMAGFYVFAKYVKARRLLEVRLMRILHVDTGRELRGGQLQLLLLLEGLQQQGHEQVLLAREPLLERWEGVRVSARALRKASRHAEVVHAHDARAHTLAAVICPDKPLIVSRRVAFPVGAGLLSRWKYARADHFVAVSLFVKEELIRSGIPSQKVTVVYDGVTVDLGDAANNAKAPASNPTPVILAPQLDDPLKGAVLLTEACRTAGLQPKFSRDLPADLRQADLFVYLSESEGLGSAILLAMAGRVPVVASRIGGIPELIEHEVHGLLVDNQSAAVAAAIRRMIEDAKLARECAERARQRVLSEFSDAIMVRQTEQVYQTVLGLRSPSWSSPPV